ncbi:MAG: hypothetical protein R2817_03375 [Flavobacteriales bacterium]
MNNLSVLTYFIYLPLTLALTFYVARILFRNARVFMLDIFNGRTELADSTNRLFEVGFYLLNIGFALWIMEVRYTLHDTQDVVERLAGKVGGFSIYLGIVLFLHLALFFRGKRKARELRAAQPTSVTAA